MRGYSLEALAALGGLDAVIAQHGVWFLVVHFEGAGPLAPMRTRTPFVGDTTIEAGFVIHPLRRRPESLHNFVSVGRVAGNDVCLFDATVSKFHAYFRETSAGLTVQDARSRNGTVVDNVAVPARGAGDAVVVVAGQTIRFGSRSATLVGAEAVWAMCRRLHL